MLNDDPPCLIEELSSNDVVRMFGPRQHIVEHIDIMMVVGNFKLSRRVVVWAIGASEYVILGEGASGRR